MKCKSCGRELLSFISSTCLYYGKDNSSSSSDKKRDNDNSINKPKPFDPYDWDNPDNCSDREYMDDDDYDDFDN